ncbi:MAG: SH3 domain-containing protein [Lachnospiraceae bacterium]|nr:SH3 domain-containing protein [Lachnospiraceae bacterium]
MRKRIALALIGTMCVMTLASGCGSKKEEAEAEATEAATEISITADVVEESTEPVVAEEPEVEQYDFSTQETVSEPEVPEAAAEVDEYGVSSISEVKLYATETVRIRRQPNTDSEIAGKLAAGDEVTANGKSEEWHRIVRNGETLYVKSEYLTETKPEKTEENETTDTAEADTATTETATTDTSATDAAATASQTTTTDTTAATADAAATDTSSASTSTTTDTTATDAAAAAAAQAAAAQAAAAQAAATVSIGKYKDYDFTEAQIANDWNSHGLSKTVGKTWNELSEGEKSDAAYHYSHYGASGW